MTVITNDKLTGLLNDINTIDDVVESQNNTTTSKLGTSVRTLKGANAAFDSAIRNAGGTPLGDGQWSTGKTYTEFNQYLYFNGVPYKPLLVPYTTQGADPTSSPDAGNIQPWQTVDELQAIARSLNVADTDVIYGTDTVTLLDNVSYIYDAPTQTTFGVPTLDSTGKTIVSVSGSDLTTTGGTGSNSYTLSNNGVRYTVDTVADLSNLPNLVGARVYWLGYYSVGDGGSNWGVIKSGTHTADYGRTFSISSNTYIEANHSGQSMNVKKYGAMGESFNDDQTDRLQQVFDLGGKIVFSRRADGTGGDYGIYDTNTARRGLYPQPNSEIVGRGLPELKLMSPACNCISNILPDFYDRPVAASGKDNILIQGIKFNGNATLLADPSTIGPIPVDGSPDIPTEQGDNFSYGVYIVLGKDISIKKCEFEDFWYGGHNLFGCDGQVVKGNKYSNIGPATAFYPNYTAMGSDGTPNFPSRRVTYLSNEIVDCGGVLRANGGINNGSVSVSDTWIIRANVASSIRSSGGFSLYRGRYENITIEYNRVEDCDGRGVSVTGDGETYAELSLCKNIRIRDNELTECCKTITGQAVIYAFAGDGVVEVARNSIYARHGNQLSNDSIVIAGEYNGSSTVYAKKYDIKSNSFDCSFDYHVNIIGTPNTHIRGNNFTGVPIQYYVNIANTASPFIYKNSFASASNISTGAYNLGYIKDNTGYKTSNSGLDTVSNASTIAHGIDAGAPPIILVTPREDTDLQVTASADATNITFYVKNADGTATGSSVSVSWSCKHWVEFEKA